MPNDVPLRSEHANTDESQLIFDAVWTELELRHGRDRLCFPKEIIWLGGAPGAGKGTNTPLIMRERGIHADPIVTSDLLTTPEAERIKAQGQLVGDREVIGLLFDSLLRPEFQNGVIVDGFPRTPLQAACIKMLHRRMHDLYREFFDTPLGPHFRRPKFHICMLYVEEKQSIERQLGRGRHISEHNRKVQETGKGELQELRPTDVSEEAARKRYQIFMESTFEALNSLRETFVFHFIDATGDIASVEENIRQEFSYQSSMELGERTLDTISQLPLASEVGKYARQQLVRRLDAYQNRHTALFIQVVDVLREEVMPVVQRHALAGYAVVEIENGIFDDSLAQDMVVDLLTERGFNCSVRVRVNMIPDRLDPATNQITCKPRTVYEFRVWFKPSPIRR